VLFMDIVAYSKLPMEQACDCLGKLQDSVRNTATFARAQRKDRLICLPTGDGMALVFFGDPESPVCCATELTQALRQHPEIKLRMGIHTGPVYRVADINANLNVAGGGINMAQRVMDCGDAGHILVSNAVAEVLAQLSAWSPFLRDLGEVEVKHGIRVRIHNFHTGEAGNPELPQKLRTLFSLDEAEGLQPLAIQPRVRTSPSDAARAPSSSPLGKPRSTTPPSGRSTPTPVKGTPTSSRTTPKPSRSTLDPSVLDSVGNELAAFIGPIAKMIVKRAAERCSSMDDLYTAVASEIGSEQDRSRFLSHKKQRL